ncbi:hypothetical protein F383_38227 [Gossypium arboreum]|uniref:Uncharacterized protein n=1 Tax=Gossypium arboreum TaxID=29729 RepID=A0A0B0MI41_GOSAR|nr:hypothetical protein F383_38227 [Gossypium arboreum]
MPLSQTGSYSHIYILESHINAMVLLAHIYRNPMS